MIETKNLGVLIEGKTILKDISSSFNVNEVSFIIGPNGAGKTSLIKLLTQQIKPSEGSILLNSRSIESYGRKELAKFVGVLSQSIDIAFPLNVEEVVMMGRYPHFTHKPSAADRQICKEAMAFFDIEKLAGRSYLDLSGGEKQRVQFARVAAQIWPDASNQKKFLFLDEPLTYLDVYYQYRFMQQIRELGQKQPLTIIGVVHDLNMAMRYGDKIILLKDQRVLAQGKPKEVFTKELIYEAFRVEPHFLMDDSGNRFFSF